MKGRDQSISRASDIYLDSVHYLENARNSLFMLNRALKY